MSIVFKWPSGPEEVIVTGTFDNWSQQLPLIKQNDGNFELEVPLPTNEEKVEFKFVVDGEWKVSDDYWTVVDDLGNVNNYVEVGESGVKSKGVDDRGVVGKTIIPESGLSVKKEEDVVSDIPSAGVEPTTATAGVGETKPEENAPVPEEIAGASAGGSAGGSAGENAGAVSAKDAGKEKQRKYVKRVAKKSEGKVDDTDKDDAKKGKKKSIFSRLLKK